MKAFITRTHVILLALLIGITAAGSYQPAVSAAAGPDLTVTEITLSPSEPAIGDTVTVTAAIKNLGDTASGTSYVTCYVDETILKTGQVSAIQPGITVTASFTWTATGGTHTIRVIADASGIISESDESNNAGTYSLTTTAPDLVLLSIAWLPENPSRGDNVVFSVTIKNNGNLPSRYTSLNLFIDDGARGVQDVATIQPGATVIKTYTWTMLEGEHTVKAVIDENNNNKESDETNNQLTVMLGTLPADLIVENITWWPVNPSKDDIVSFNITVTNAGSGRAGQSYLGYYIDNVLLDSLLMEEMEAGASQNATFTWKATLDAHNVKAVADCTGRISESNENNNSLEISLQALPPDLVISDLTWTPTDPAAGDTIVFTITVKNLGGGRADPSRLVFRVGTKNPLYLDVPSIEAGAEVNVLTEWVAESGDYDIALQADYLLVIRESNENNNRYQSAISVFPPDITITGITFSPEKPVLDEMVTFNVTIKNQGKGRASAFNVSFYIDDESQSFSNVNSLASEASTIVFCKWKVTGGHHIFKAVIDFGNVLSESNEKNNTASVPIAPNMPDLSVTNVTWSPAAIPAGQNVVFVIVVENLGGVTAEPSRLVYYVDDTIAGFNDIGSVMPGEKVTQSFTWAASSGVHAITVSADSKAQITEIDEANNTVTINIPPPDLVFQAVSYTPEDAGNGAAVVITASIMNVRGSKTPISMVMCYVDGTAIGAKNLAALAAGETGEVSFEWTAEPGSHVFKVTADVYKTVMETDETNNEGQTVFITGSPDLAIDNIQWQTDSTLNSKEVSLTITVSNTGRYASGAFSLQCAFDRAEALTRQVPSIPAGQTANVTIKSILSDGPHTAYIVLDSGHEVSEMDEENNTDTFSFSTIAPDLIIRSITWSPMTAAIGDEITITAKIENLGESAAAAIGLKLTVDGAEAGYLEIPDIDGGAVALADFTWTALEGEHTIDILADAGQTITESNETNNTRSRTITFSKQEKTVNNTPLITLGAADSGSLLDQWWWMLLLAGVVLGLGVLYTTIRNMRKK